MRLEWTGLVLLGALGLVAACSGGLLLDEGNAFPCDYAAGEVVRDAQCAGGWRCGIDSRCHPDSPEEAARGPAPDFTQGTRRYPRLLDGPARFVAAHPRDGTLFVGYEDGGLAYTDGVRAEASAASAASGKVEGAAFVGGKAALALEPFPLRPSALVVGTPSRGAPSPLDWQPVRLEGLDASVPDVRGLRAVTSPVGWTPEGLLAVLLPGSGAGEVDLASARLRPFPAGALPLGGAVPACLPVAPGCVDGGMEVAGLYADARPVPEQSLLPFSSRSEDAGTSQRLVPVVATPGFFLWRSEPPDASLPGGLWRVLNPEEPIGASMPPARDGGTGGEPFARWLLRHSDGAGLWALRRPLPDGREVLSTWVLSRSPARPREPRLERAWDDCSPCGAGRLVTFTPVTDGALGVEVLCESPTGARTLARVVGASVVTPQDACLTQPLAAPVPLDEVAAVDESNGAALALGGAHGQLWRGPRLSALTPLFLDRVPLRALPLGDGLLAVTPDFLALEARGLTREERTGLTVVVPGGVDGGLEGAGTREVARLGGVVDGVQGWLLLDNSQLVRLQPGAREAELGRGYGPVLLGADGAPARGPYLGQGLAVPDAGVSLVMAAGDQLYALETTAAQLSTEPEAQPGLNPRLTPESGFPVRSLARDGTVLPGGEEPRVRGWVATSRSLFEYAQSEAGQWSLTPLRLGSAEPVEVWSREVEVPRRAYGRVGLRDGQVLKVPDGLPLTTPLPEGERALDYADVNGWPVVLTEKALYRTEATEGTAGREGLLRWVPLTPPAGLDSGALRGARIEVVPEGEPGKKVPVLYLFTATGFVYRL